jgi:hypothetical protein
MISQPVLKKALQKGENVSGFGAAGQAAHRIMRGARANRIVPDILPQSTFGSHLPAGV